MLKVQRNSLKKFDYNILKATARVDLLETRGSLVEKRGFGRFEPCQAKISR